MAREQEPQRDEVQSITRLELFLALLWTPVIYMQDAEGIEVRVEKTKELAAVLWSLGLKGRGEVIFDQNGETVGLQIFWGAAVIKELNTDAIFAAIPAELKTAASFTGEGDYSSSASSDWPGT
jgi:hypothetical protein